MPEERALLLLDARINARGIAANIPFLEAARTLAVNERNAINTRLDHLTAGVIKSVDQVQKIREAVNACGQDLGSLGKRSVAAALAGQPEGFARELLVLRQQRRLQPRRASTRSCWRSPTRSITAFVMHCASMAPDPGAGVRLAPGNCRTSPATTASCPPR